ncbi:pentapeptide repeat-containing protein [Geothrix mesophila]|uniref:pentapeptide repeat-containing protein n=1 Tax=Geothrix mesophila TaxID=2922723 RepID=UPI001FABCE48|nr:pentapeptide repeat-containing protein [Geothrix sp. SG198]
MEFPTRPGDKLESVDFQDTIINKDFSNFRIEWCRGKSIKFQNCNFHSALFRLCYFHKASFVNCDFTGSIFVDSNLRGATFEQCKFHYSQFKSTQVDLSQIEKNLPEWENCRRELLRNLRKNAESIGEVDDVRRAFALEMESAHEHWRNACKQPSQYYKSHYKGFQGKFYAWKNRISLLTQKYYWGYGESPLRLMFFTVLILLIFSLMLRPVNVVEKELNFYTKFTSLFLSTLGGKSSILENRSQIFLCLFSLFRLASIGLFAATVVRRLARR